MKTKEAKTIDINAPIRFTCSATDEIIHLVDVLFQNGDVCLATTDNVIGSSYVLFNVKEGQVMSTSFGNPITLGWVAKNYDAPAVEQTLSAKADEFARRAHTLINQTYDGKSYMHHINMADDVGKRFIHLIPEEDRESVIAGIKLHDCGEDAWHISYNDIKKEFGEKVAEMVHAVSNEKGRNRAERANHKYYQGIVNTPYATFIKLCDRISHLEYGIEVGGSSMLDKYRRENPNFKAKLYSDAYKEMFDHIETLLK